VCQEERSTASAATRRGANELAIQSATTTRRGMTASPTGWAVEWRGGKRILTAVAGRRQTKPFSPREKVPAGRMRGGWRQAGASNFTQRGPHSIATAAGLSRWGLCPKSPIQTQLHEASGKRCRNSLCLDLSFCAKPPVGETERD